MMTMMMIKIGTVFKTVTETAVFDRNRRKPKPQDFMVRDTVEDDDDRRQYNPQQQLHKSSRDYDTNKKLFKCDDSPIGGGGGGGGGGGIGGD